MTDTDVALFESDVSYAEIETEGIHAFALSGQSAPVGASVDLISGYMEQEQSCLITSIIPELKEATINTIHAYRYGGCKSLPGWSGTPMIATGTHVIVGVNNTHYSGGAACTINNPCEINASGQVSVGPIGTSYGQQTALLWTCIDRSGNFDLQNPGCVFR